MSAKMCLSTFSLCKNMRVWISILRMKFALLSEATDIDDIGGSGGGGGGGNSSSNNNKQRHSTNVIKMNRYIGVSEQRLIWWENVKKACSIVGRKSIKTKNKTTQSEEEKKCQHLRLAIGIIEMRLILHVATAISVSADWHGTMPIEDFWCKMYIQVYIVCTLLVFLYIFYSFSLWYEWPIRIRIMACWYSTERPFLSNLLALTWDAQKCSLIHLLECVQQHNTTDNATNDDEVFAVRHNLWTIQLNLYALARSVQCIENNENGKFLFRHHSRTTAYCSRWGSDTQNAYLWIWKKKWVVHFRDDLNYTDETPWSFTLYAQPKKAQHILPDASMAIESVRWISILWSLRIRATTNCRRRSSRTFLQFNCPHSCRRCLRWLLPPNAVSISNFPSKNDFQFFFLFIYSRILCQSCAVYSTWCELCE